MHIAKPHSSVHSLLQLSLVLLYGGYAGKVALAVWNSYKIDFYIVRLVTYFL